MSDIIIELDQTEKEISRFRQKKLQKGITVLAQGYHVSVLAALRVYEIGMKTCTRVHEQPVQACTCACLYTSLPKS